MVIPIKSIKKPREAKIIYQNKQQFFEVAELKLVFSHFQMFCNNAKFKLSLIFEKIQFKKDHKKFDTNFSSYYTFKIYCCFKEKLVKIESYV